MKVAILIKKMLQKFLEFFNNYTNFVTIWFLAFVLDYSVTMIGIANGYKDSNPWINEMILYKDVTVTFRIVGLILFMLLITKVLWNEKIIRIMWIVPLLHVIGFLSWMPIFFNWWWFW